MKKFFGVTDPVVLTRMNDPDLRLRASFQITNSERVLNAMRSITRLYVKAVGGTKGFPAVDNFLNDGPQPIGVCDLMSGTNMHLSLEQNYVCIYPHYGRTALFQHPDREVGNPKRDSLLAEEITIDDRMRECVRAAREILENVKDLFVPDDEDE